MSLYVLAVLPVECIHLVHNCKTCLMCSNEILYGTARMSEYCICDNSELYFYFSFCVFLCFLCTTASTTITTRMMKHPATPAATDEAIMTTLLEVLGGGGVVGGVSALLIEAWVGGGVIGRVSAAPIEG